MNEEWKDIKGYEGLYQASTYGRIKSLSRDGNNKTKKDRIMKQCNSKKGNYLTIRLCKNKNTKLFKVHRLVAMTFIDNPNNYTDVNHLDGDKHNNYISNLEWCSRKHNIEHAYKLGLRKVKKIRQINSDGELIKEWSSMSAASADTNIDISKICMCCRKQKATAGGFIWEYAE